MSSYKIKPYSYAQAKKLNVSIKVSSNPKKKIDVITPDKKIIQIGAAGYGDFPTWLKEKGKAYAYQKRKNYKARHERDRHKKNTAGFYADNILW